MIDKNCYFCDSTDVEPFAQYYTNCKKCSAIYVKMIVWDANCKHINSASPTVLRRPYYKMLEDHPAIIEIENKTQACSVCFKTCVSGG